MLDNFKGIEPTYISVDQEILIRALRAAEDAKEWATELLAVHDRDLGRTTVKNRLWANHLEKSIDLANRSINELKDSLGYCREFP